MILSQIMSVKPVLDFFLAILSCIRHEGQSKKVASQEQDKYAKGRAEDLAPHAARGNITKNASEMAKTQ